MTTLGLLALALSAGGAVVAGLLAALFVRDPARGMVQVTHRTELLPQVMADRYSAMFLLAVGATIHGDMKVIAWLFAAFALMGFWDAAIYLRAGHPYMKHLLSGIAAALVVLAALAAMATNGAT